MKWKHPGHEFDHVYEHIRKKRNYYLFGAGDYGRLFADAMKDELDLVAFIDNNEAKHGGQVAGLPCIRLSEVEKTEDAAIILTVSQMQRGDIIVQLEQAGWQKDVDFFIIEEFLSVYCVYKYDKVYFLSISFLPSTACNLRCVPELQSLCETVLHPPVGADQERYRYVFPRRRPHPAFPCQRRRAVPEPPAAGRHRVPRHALRRPHPHAPHRHERHGRALGRALCAPRKDEGRGHGR